MLFITMYTVELVGLFCIQLRTSYMMEMHRFTWSETASKGQADQVWGDTSTPHGVWFQPRLQTRFRLFFLQFNKGLIRDQNKCLRKI